MPTSPANNSNLCGLTQTNTTAKLASEGMNELPTGTQRNLFGIALEVVREPMFLLLVVAGAIYLLLGDVTDALMLLGFVCIVMAITIYQEYKTERVLEALRNLTSPRALVIRDGLEQRMPAAKWCAMTSSCSPKAIVCRQMPSYFRAMILLRMNLY